ncbi:MAG: polymer-forming cytoskeletal protein [Bacteroidetes bacterium]|nr:MAG: polymer-forming cytoskeletal protein [Bacteroidota bacterium]
MAKMKETEMPSINLLGSGTTVKGDIKLNGDFRIDGTLVGKIDCKGKIVVGPSGIIEGDISCQNADFSGQIKAQVKVAELLTLKDSARFSGDIVTNKLAIEPGARFSGTCQMEGVTKEKIPTQPLEEPRSEAKS